MGASRSRGAGEYPGRPVSFPAPPRRPPGSAAAPSGRRVGRPHGERSLLGIACAPFEADGAMRSSVERLADRGPRLEEAAKQRQFVARELAFLDQFTVLYDRAVHLVERFGIGNELPQQPFEVNAVDQ